MTINSIIEKCLDRAREFGWGLQKQNELAAQVVHKMRPEWSDSQIDDTINRVRSSASSEIADC